jgi:hypothetical protein
LAKNYLDTEEEQEEFRKKLAALNLPNKEIEQYEKLFTSSNVIVFSELILRDDFFLKALPHERLHKMLSGLEDKEYGIMKNAVKEIIKKQRADGTSFIQEKNFEGKDSFGMYAAAAKMNWKEFYTYLAQGEFEDFVLSELKEKHNDAYRIFDELKNLCEIEK